MSDDCRLNGSASRCRWLVVSPPWEVGGWHYDALTLCGSKLGPKGVAPALEGRFVVDPLAVKFYIMVLHVDPTEQLYLMHFVTVLSNLEDFSRRGSWQRSLAIPASCSWAHAYVVLIPKRLRSPCIFGVHE